jgi:hypothetical protein
LYESLYYALNQVKSLTIFHWLGELWVRCIGILASLYVVFPIYCGSQFCLMDKTTDLLQVIDKFQSYNVVSNTL